MSRGGRGGGSSSGGGGDLFAGLSDFSGGLSLTLDEWKLLDGLVSISDGGGDLFLNLLDLLLFVVDGLATLEVGDLGGDRGDGGSVVINGLLSGGLLLLEGLNLGGDDSLLRVILDVLDLLLIGVDLG